MTKRAAIQLDLRILLRLNQQANFTASICPAMWTYENLTGDPGLQHCKFDYFRGASTPQTLFDVLLDPALESTL